MCARSVARVLSVWLVCARALGLVLVVVAGRFWCSYAWVSLTQTARVRPRAPGIERVRACALLIRARARY